MRRMTTVVTLSAMTTDDLPAFSCGVNEAMRHAKATLDGFVAYRDAAYTIYVVAVNDDDGSVIGELFDKIAAAERALQVHREDNDSDGH